MISTRQNLTVIYPEDSNPMDETDYELDLQYINVSFALSCVLLSFCVIGAVTNFISTIIYSHPAMRSSINVLLTGLSITDLCLCIFAVPTFVFPSMCVYMGFKEGGTADNTLCTLTTYSTLYIYPLTTMTQTCSVWTFVVITFERWIAVCHPFRARWASTGRSLRALGVVCVMAAAYNFIRFFEYSPPKNPITKAPFLPTWPLNGSEIENETEFYEQGDFVDELLRKDEYYMQVYYSGLYLVTHFLIPFSVLAGINGKMIYSIHQARQERRMLSHSEKKEHRTALMMGLVVLMFVFCNTLTFVLNFVEQLDKNLFVYRSTKILMFTLNDVSNLLILLNASATFGFYYACSQKYRQLLHYYLINFWCSPCISSFCPTHYEQNRSRFRSTSKMGFSFHSGISLCALPGNDHGDTASARVLIGTVHSRRCSAVILERVNYVGQHGDSSNSGPSDERRSLISNGKYLTPITGQNRRWSSVFLTPPPVLTTTVQQNRLTVPGFNKRTGSNKTSTSTRGSTFSIKSAQ